MICKLILIGAHAFNPCDVVALKPVIDQISDGFFTYKSVETGGCHIYLDDGSKYRMFITVEDEPCSLVTSKINRQLSREE